MIAILSLFDDGKVVHKAVTVPDPARIQSNVNIKRYAEVAAGRAIQEIVYPKQAITIRQPWAWGIVHGGKDIENRSRRMCRAGLWYFVHAGMQTDEAGYDNLKHRRLQGTGQALPDPPPGLRTYGVIGVMKLGGWVETSESPWFVGPLGIQIEAALPLPFQSGPGSQGVFAWDHARAELE